MANNLDTLVTNLQAIHNEVITKVIPTNIKSGVTIFGQAGTVVPLAGQTKTVTPSVTSQTVTPDQNYNGLTEVIVNGDVNLIAENIKAGVTIFGVTGTYDGTEPTPEE